MTETKRDARSTDTTTISGDSYQRSSLGTVWVRVTDVLGIYTSPVLALLLVAIIGGSMSARFLTVRNFTNLAGQAPIIGVMAVGMTLVMVTAGIDLSVGNLLSWFAVVGALLFSKGEGLSPWVILVILFGMGCATGVIQGSIIAFRGAAPFIVTLAFMSIGQSMALVFSKGKPITGISGPWVQVGYGVVPGLGVPIAFLIMVAWFILGDFLLSRTTFGRHVRTVGGNVHTAELSGVPVKRTLILTYLFSGLSVALGAFIFCGRVSVGDPYGGRMLELDVITATVIGGTSLFGGIGAMWGTFLGVFVVVMVNNVINYAANVLGLPPFFHPVAKGIIILIAVMLHRRRRA